MRQVKTAANYIIGVVFLASACMADSPSWVPVIVTFLCGLYLSLALCDYMKKEGEEDDKE